MLTIEEKKSLNVLAVRVTDTIYIGEEDFFSLRIFFFFLRFCLLPHLMPNHIRGLKMS